MFKKDIDYIVKDGKVVIIDEFTGRMMDGRRWSDGLHQAVEAKEGVQIEPENQTLASITFQNYFRMYPKLSGMTGTAMTEAPEFFDIYKMNVVSIPTNVPVQRIDEDDEFYKNITDKFAAIAKEIKAQAGEGPAGAGRHRFDRKVGDAVRISRQAEGIQHSVLNARFHEKEAHIVAQAGADGRGDHRHQHGRPRHRHPAWRQPRFPHRRTSLPSWTRDAGARRRPIERIRRGSRRGEAARARGRRPVRARHRAPREPPHRQPAARPLGPPGRSRPVALLPEPRRRPAAHLRPADDVRAADEQEPRGRRGDRQPVDLQGDRDRAEEGRGAQLRHPQAGRRIRRRDERPAQGHLRAARRHHGRRKRQRRDHRHARRDRGRDRRRSTARRAPIPSNGTSRASRRASTRSSASSRRSTTGCRKKRSSRR